MVHGRVAIVAGVLVTFGSAGCSAAPGQPGPVATADCQTQVRLADQLYTGYGFTDRDATAHGVAEAADCHDVGKDAPGSVFPHDPRSVRVWSFAGHPPEQVLGVRFDADSFQVLVAESATPSERDRILQQLTGPAH